MQVGRPSRARLMSVIAATVISLACGTNYVYSAWAPQFAERLKLSATQSNLIGNLANLGMYFTGIPLGIMIDKIGPRPGIALGVVLFAFGYYPLAKAFEAGPGEYGVPILCLFSFFTGMGSNAAFLAAIKICALNYPENRGTATAFPLAAFGLSASFFAAVALALPHDTPHFLLLLAAGTVVLPIVSFPFARVISLNAYKSIPQHDTQILHRRRSSVLSQDLNREDTGAHSTNPTAYPRIPVSLPDGDSTRDYDSDEVSSLLSNASSADMADLETCKSIESDRRAETPHLDVRGFGLVKYTEFWQLFVLLGLLTGIGLMTINNVGNDATALWKHFDPSTTSSFIAKRQVLHVSILSICSCLGRLVSGIGSDVLANTFNRSRFWCLLASALGFCAAQILAIIIEDPSLLIFVSGITGVSYGMLFGVYPSLIAHTFGVHGLSQNWGTVCLAPVISGNIFNLLYGAIYDSHSIVEDNGDRECVLGKTCYQTAYIVTLGAAIASVLLCLYSIYHESQVHLKGDEKEGRRRSDPSHLS